MRQDVAHDLLRNLQALLGRHQRLSTKEKLCEEMQAHTGSCVCRHAQAPICAPICMLSSLDSCIAHALMRLCLCLA